MNSPTLFSPSATVFACVSKACAPPPVGRGGSMPSATPASRWRQGVSMSGSFRYRPQKSEVRKLHKSGTADNLTLDRPFRDEADQIRLDVVGKRVNDPQFMDKWRSRDQRLGEEIARTLSGDEAGMKVFKQLAKLRLPSEYELEQYRSGDERAYALSDTNFAHRAVDIITVMMGDGNDTAPNREAFYKALGSLRRAGERTGMPPTLLQVVKAAIKAAPVLEDGEKSWEFRSPENLMASLIAGHAVGWWQQGVYHPQNIFYHQIAAEVHGVPDMQYEPEVMATVRPPDGPVLMNVIRMVTDLEYRRTQRILSEGSAPSGLVSRISKGGTVTLYRGVRGNFDESVQAGSRIKVSSNPLSSWTTDVQTAKDFSGSDEQGGAPGSNTNGVVLAMEVPVELIQSISTDGRGAMSEFEVILVSPAGEALVLDRTDGTVPMPSIPAVTASATVFACLSKACAPPPVGKGGSLRSSGMRPISESDASSVTRDLMQTMSDDYLVTHFQERVGKLSVASKIVANKRTAEKLAQDSQFNRWLRENGDTAVRGTVIAMAFHRFIESVSFTYDPDKEPYTARAVKMADDRSTTVNELAAEIAKSFPDFMGMSSEEVIATIMTRSVIDSWADNASKSPLSVLQQQAAANVHGLGDSSMNHIKDSEIAKGTLREFADSMPLMESVVRAEYETTQEWFKEQGVTSLLLYRGTGVPIRPSAGQERSDALLHSGDRIEVSLNPLSSWSFNFDAAFEFGSSQWASQRVVLESVVPVKLVQSIPVTGRGCWIESEVVVIGKPGTALVFEADDDLSKWS